MQDSYSHQGYGPTLGQAKDYLRGRDPYAADQTSTKPGKANVMAERTFNYLKNAASGHSHIKGLADGPAMSYSGLQPLIDKFSRSSSQGEKRKIIAEMEKKITQFRHLHASPTETRTMRTTTQKSY
jgi:hypothetical protein